MATQRSFSSFGNVAPYIPFAFPCNLSNLDGYAAGAGWLQIHDKASAPSGASVPLKTFNVPGAGPLLSLFQELGPITLFNGLAIAMSSTEGTYTALATSFDAEGEVDEYEGILYQNMQGLTTAGDLTTGVNNLQVFSEATGLASPKRLFQIDWKSTEAATTYLMLFASDSPANGSTPIMAWKNTDQTGIQQTLKFGDDGLRVYSQTTAYATKLGCTLCVSTTAGTLTQITDTAAKIKAQYKT